MRFYLYVALILFCCWMNSRAGASFDSGGFDKLPKNANGLQIVKLGNTFFLEINDSLLGKDFVLLCRISKKSQNLTETAETGKVADKLNETYVRFEKREGDLIVRQMGSFFVNPEASIRVAAGNSNLQPIVASFKLLAVPHAVGKNVCDITSYLLDGNSIFFIAPYYKTQLKLGAYQKDKSLLEKIINADTGIDIYASQTFAIADGFTTIELTTTIMALPSPVMEYRVADARVGYFTRKLTDYNYPQKIRTIEVITRWRLEPKEQDYEKYRNGELVEPKKPIVFYIDPATPKDWVPYLMAGVTDWQPAFEQAGFKHAIVAKAAPSYEEDSAWSISSSRYSNLIYIATETGDASYSTVADPRSGEIIQSNIRWYHGIMKVLHDRYFVQASPNDPGARKQVFDKELMGALIRNTCSHEIGHALGFPHNFGASATVPVEKLRDKKWVEDHGHTPSIMDYSRFNYVAQPEDKISPKGLFNYVGKYDKWAIEWGYRYSFNSSYSFDSLKKQLLQKALDSLCWYGAENKYNDPRCQYEDLSSNVLEANYYGMKNLHFIMEHIEDWALEDNWTTGEFKEMFQLVVQQYWRYLTHAAVFVGGVYEDEEEGGVRYSKVAGRKQIEAINFLDQYLFGQAPGWLFKSSVLAKTNEDPYAIMAKIYSNILGLLISTETLKRLPAESQTGEAQFGPDNLLRLVHAKIWSELPSARPVNKYRRILQHLYVTLMGNKLDVSSINRLRNPVLSEWSMLARADLDRLKEEVRKSIVLCHEKNTVSHLKDVLKKVTDLLNHAN